MIRQNIVFVENKAGSLKKVTDLLKAESINIFAFACFDTPEFAIFRMVCNAPEKAERILNEKGYMNRITSVIVVNLKDEVGRLDELLGILAERNVSLNYIYTSFHRESLTPVIILHSEDLFATESILQGNGFSLLSRLEDFEK
ncbi:MAG: amino acid-binding protein [Blautia sp.]|nr:amino acid-binding protein [Blautia sp.]